jgi:hypothetical protein
MRQIVEFVPGDVVPDSTIDGKRSLIERVADFDHQLKKILL